MGDPGKFADEWRTGSSVLIGSEIHSHCFIASLKSRRHEGAMMKLTAIGLVRARWW